MSILELPPELLQLTIDVAVQDSELQCAIRFREVCHLFDEVVQRSIFRLPKANLLQRRLGFSMRRKLVHTKMRLGNANELLLCYTINRIADYLTERDTYVSRDRYVNVLETAAVDTLMYWRLLDCLTIERERTLGLQDLKDNALVAAVGVKDTTAVQKLLEEGANASSNTPLFGEPLALAASSGSLAMVQLLLDHWNWEENTKLTGFRLANAIETAAAAGHEGVFTKLLEHKDWIVRSAYEDVIFRLVKRNQTTSVERLLSRRLENFMPPAKTQFWLRLVRTAAEYDQRRLMQQILAKYLPDTEKDSLVAAMQDACLENHGQMLPIILPHVSVSGLACHADSLFWAAWFGNVEALQHLLTFLKNDQRALLLACAGAVSGKKLEAIAHLCKAAGVSPISKDILIRFTDIARLIFSNKKSGVLAEVKEPLSASEQGQILRVAARKGKLADVINASDAMQADHPGNVSGIAGAFSDAAKNKRLDVLLFLCENWSPHLITSCVKSPAVAQVFSDFGWDIGQTVQGHKYPRLGEFVHDEHFTRWLLDKGAAADARGEFDITAVSLAIRRSSMSTIKLLLHRSSGIQQGRLLHFAILRQGDDSLEIVDLLLNLDCPIDSIWLHDYPRSWLEWDRGEAGTALFNAAKQGRHDMVAHLLSRGADATVVSNKGRTALDVAERKQQSRVVRILRQFT